MSRKILLTLVGVIVLIFASTGVVRSEPGAPPILESPTHQIGYHPGELPILQAPYSIPEQSEIAAVNLLSWSRVAFQSYRSGNWEIYVANDDGTGQSRLTNHSASDTYPRLNRGATRIAFSSNRSGNYEIFTINVDGSGLKQLTAQAAHDYNPAWSPDGSKIVFNSYRDGQSEIYVMNADGSNQTRLTFDAAYDGGASWSPDGSKIAFQSSRSGGSAIWVMNADGSAPTLLAAQPYAENPVWSPDGSQIAYDADGNSDGWQEIWVMNADGSNQYGAYAPSEANTDAWVRSWSPDGRYIAFTRITLIYYQGNWYWLYAYLDAWNTSVWNTVRLNASDTEWYPDWQTTDIQAPNSGVDSLPAYSRNSLIVSWYGSDLGGAGIKGYDVQYRDAAVGSWQAWLMQTDETYARFSGTPGHTYDFRVRAVDNSNNAEAWPYRYATTALYSWKIAGTVRTHTGLPVTGATLDVTPASFLTLTHNGRYQLYVDTEADSYAVNWGKEGYGNLPTSTFTASFDGYVDAVLPPADNLVQNWGFEGGEFDDWITGGIIAPTVVTTTKHTGNYAAMLGSPEFLFSSPESIDDYGEVPQMAVAADGTVHVVWALSDWNKTDIFYTQRSPAGNWSPAQLIVNAEGPYNNSIGMLLDQDGQIHVIWQSGPLQGTQKIMYTVRTAQGVWATPQEISGGFGGYSSSFIMDQNNLLHVFWFDQDGDVFRLYYRNRSSDGTWSAVQNLFTSAIWEIQLALTSDNRLNLAFYTDTGVYFSQRNTNGTWSAPREIQKRTGSIANLRLRAGNDQTLHLIWTEGSYDSTRIFYTQRKSDGTWLPVYILTDSIDMPRPPQLVLDRNNIAHMIYLAGGQGYPSLYYIRQEYAGLWSTPEYLGLIGYSGSPNLVASDEGTLHLFWGGSADWGEDVYHRQWRNGIWSAPAKIGAAGHLFNNSQVIAQNDAKIRVAWQGYDAGPGKLWYLETAPVTSTGTSTLATVVTLPQSPSIPVLSFLYQLEGVSSDNHSWFTVDVSNGMSSTTLLSATSGVAGQWLHSWASLEKWGGQTVTLTFALHQTVDHEVGRVYLDEISVGTTYPDLWVAQESSDALPGSQVIYTLVYGNQGAAPAEDVRIVNLLPVELSYVDANPKPIDETALLPALAWDLGTLPAMSGPFTIVVTTTVPLTVPMFSTLNNTTNITSASPELELGNNYAYEVIFVGYQVYLPLTVKKW